MNIFGSVVTWIMKKRIHQMELFIKYPYEVQQEVFRKLLGDAGNTEWGIKYGYTSILNYEDFKNKVPLSTYEDLHPYIERIMNGEQNLLWHSDIKWFAKSSGTTNDRSKFIPVSQESLEDCHFKAGKDLLSIYCNNFPDNKMFDGKGLALGGSHQINQLDSMSYYGDLSAVLMQNLPVWANFYRVPELNIALMDNWEGKIEKLALSTIRENVTNIAGVPTWTMVLLKWILDYTGKNNILEVWPNLELYIHGGVSFLPYKAHFETLVPSKKMNYLETYNASEGFFGIQDQIDSTEMLLMLDYGIFFEFIPMSRFEESNPPTVLLDQVDLFTNYAVVISTNAGLWRYLIGDTIRFTSKEPFRFIITGRTKHFINAFGEELIIDNAERALEKACQVTHAQLVDYTAAPVFLSISEKGAHEWAIEFEKEPDNFNYFSQVLDNTLKELNTDYEAKRKNDMAMVAPKINKVKKGTFHHWLEQKNKLGGQHKIPRLSNNRLFIEQILNISKTMLLCIVLLWSNDTFAQNNQDSSRVDTTKWKVKKLQPPQKAAILSSVLPGAGQVYNQKYWKTPLVWGAMGFMIWQTDSMNRYYQDYRLKFRSKYLYEIDDTGTLEDPYPGISSSSFKTVRDKARRNRDLLFILSTGVYILNIIDASVDAHLMGFDISDDLSLAPLFSYDPMMQQGYSGLSIRLKL